MSVIRPLRDRMSEPQANEHSGKSLGSRINNLRQQEFLAKETPPQNTEISEVRKQVLQRLREANTRLNEKNEIVKLSWDSKNQLCRDWIRALTQDDTILTDAPKEQRDLIKKWINEGIGSEELEKRLFDNYVLAFNQNKIDTPLQFIKKALGV